MHRLKTQRRVFSPHHGFFVILPPTFRRQGVVPPHLFIAELMRFLDRSYYVGLLSAAALHGASHQQPMEYQVVTDRALRTINHANLRIRFIVKKELRPTPIVEMKTEAGMLRVSTPEATALDLVRYERWAGGWDNVATVLVDLSEKLDAEALAAAAAHSDIATVQRLGVVLDRFAESPPTAKLAALVEKRPTRYVKLRADAPTLPSAERSQRWRAIINDNIEPDIA